jgi:tRNA dimethylallyltransferase
MSQKIIVILGPTASGKSSLGIELAQMFNGEIISADSRQVYKGMDIGTGKVSRREQRLIPHHLLDVASPKKQFTVSDFKRHLSKAIASVRSRGKIPFIVGGTAFYIYAGIDEWKIPEVKPNPKLRRELEKKSLKELQKILKKLDPRRFETIDKANRVRLVRAIEINIETGSPVPSSSVSASSSDKVLILGIKKDFAKLDKLINERVDQRLKQGMVAEVKKLLKSGISHRRLHQFGLEYRFISDYLQGKLEYGEMVSKLKIAIHQFARRQMTWFRRDPRIHWVLNKREAEKLVKKFIQ